MDLLEADIIVLHIFTAPEYLEIGTKGRPLARTRETVPEIFVCIFIMGMTFVLENVEALKTTQEFQVCNV